MTKYPFRKCVLKIGYSIPLHLLALPDVDTYLSYPIIGHLPFGYFIGHQHTVKIEKCNEAGGGVSRCRGRAVRAVNAPAADINGRAVHARSLNGAIDRAAGPAGRGGAGAGGCRDRVAGV
ncbi:hypothetical protein EVAR_13683_1 [Eumeta japonica]|uniref:Uncharacterized protein n=1 Tax=Eumeta variegata TaxID=151549 RepID=A0A4C1UC73_EUMVA|nr:hypothetical protein EVAR_13683_1 [Eumeta japonica]